MTTKDESKRFLGALVTVICFVIGCLFLYWAVQYWVYNNFDSKRYDLVKIQPAQGVDSLNAWKLDRRTGALEYCSVTYPLREGAKNLDDRETKVVCLRAHEIDTKAAKDEKKEAASKEPAPVEPPVAAKVEQASPPPIPETAAVTSATPVQAPAATATSP